MRELLVEAFMVVYLVWAQRLLLVIVVIEKDGRGELPLLIRGSKVKGTKLQTKIGISMILRKSGKRYLTLVV